MNLKTQSGRSMTEMLGTLAIIGVLSIGGITGYSYGMDKYRCNKTTNDISLRRVDLMTQASQGRSTLSLSEWANESTIYDITNPTYGEGGLIKFDVGATNKIPQSVCEMLFDGLSNTVAQIDINGTTSTSNDSCGENNTMTFYFASGGNASAGTGTGGGTTGEQCGGTVCGECQKCECNSDGVGQLSVCGDTDLGKQCVPIDDYEQKCTVNGQTGWCVSGACEPDTTCNCGKGYYCTDKNWDGGSCEHPPPSGNCVEAEPQFRTVDIAGTTYYISNDKMTWWDAVSACKALGNKQLLTVEDIVVRNDDDTTGYFSYEHVKTSVGEALYSEMGGEHIWSSTLWDSCSAYWVSLEAGHVRFDWRNYGTSDSYAVCR